MTYRIDGVDITPYIAFGGIKWSRNDVDGPSAGRTQSGYMVRDYIATKYRWDITCRPLTSEEQSTLLQLIQPEYVTFEYDDPLDLVVRSAEYYSNNFPSTFALMRPNGTIIWTGLTFPLVQA